MNTHTQRAYATSRIAVVGGAEPADWQKLFNRIHSRPAGFTVLLTNGCAAMATLVSLFAAVAFMSWGVWQMYPDIASHILACFVVPPAFLFAAATGLSAGNLFLRLWFGMNGATRRGFASRLTLGHAPDIWPGLVRRWLFTGNWQGTPACDYRMPYMRIFVVGDAPATCSQEDAIWREVHRALCGEAIIEAGCNHREISYPAELPRWSNHIGKGDGLDALRERIGAESADEWVAHLWRRASRQWPALGGSAFPASHRRDCLELHRLPLPGGRDGLAVILRPSTAPETAVVEGRHVDTAAA